MAYPEYAPGDGPAGPEAWQRVLRDAVRDVEELARLLALPPDAMARWVDGATQFPLLVPRGFVARMRQGDPDDPLLAQVLPRIDERIVAAGYSADPLDEGAFSEFGVVRKYRGRALLITTGACPIHCRYCFRRHFPYSSELAAREDWLPAMTALPADTTEIILSGGDPLSLSTRRLANLLERLEARPKLRYLRVHTRYPITIPERVDDALLALLERTRLKTIVVVHTNHPNEVDDRAVRHALQRLVAANDAVLNQSVLLRGVNDSVQVLSDLSRALFESNVLPYYLHMLDHVSGAAHFEVDENRAKAIVAELRTTLPGFLVPRLVRETPGELSKTPVC